LVFSTRTNYM